MKEFKAIFIERASEIFLRPSRSANIKTPIEIKPWALLKI